MALHCMNWFHFHFPRKSKAANTHVFREGRRLPEPFLRHGFIVQFLNHVKSSPGWTEWWRRAICFQSFQAGLLCCVAESSQAAQSGFSLSSDAGAGKHPKSSASWGQPSAPLACSRLESGFPWESTCCSAGNSRTASECGLCSSLWQLRQQQHLWERKLYPSMKL